MEHRRFALLSVWLVIGLLFPGLWPAGVQAQGCGWERQNPLPGLSGVWGSSGGDIFAVGDYGTIVHYDGTDWSPMSSGTTAWLSGVWGSSGGDVFAV
jgi:hypothetical protein